ncbi:hypothetical protein TRV_04822 [Trichophyton verrucosum HKI 0517]|uniref:Uncharacterized protein n=1 Tax=Trichophyton verrucosum (strain HKI 0517) TaxID=663202 RepID=D4DCG8_TRIVH|nr:uncharacterized protein TRV_04822 [Trichophyton verrucosum HKI 0517]EFE40453.1 hypothetical protein TRV_04822 [Trichophyton verrucosum HKI 0517]
MAPLPDADVDAISASSLRSHKSPTLALMSWNIGLASRQRYITLSYYHSSIRLPTYASIAAAVSTIPPPAAALLSILYVGLRLHVQTFISTRTNPPLAVGQQGDEVSAVMGMPNSLFSAEGAPVLPCFNPDLMEFFGHNLPLVLKSSAGTEILLSRAKARNFGHHFPFLPLLLGKSHVVSWI